MRVFYTIAMNPEQLSVEDRRYAFERAVNALYSNHSYYDGLDVDYEDIEIPDHDILNIYPKPWDVRIFELLVENLKKDSLQKRPRFKSCSLVKWDFSRGCFVLSVDIKSDPSPEIVDDIPKSLSHLLKQLNEALLSLEMLPLTGFIYDETNILPQFFKVEGLAVYDDKMYDDNFLLAFYKDGFYFSGAKSDWPYWFNGSLLCVGLRNQPKIIGEQSFYAVVCTDIDCKRSSETASPTSSLNSFIERSLLGKGAKVITRGEEDRPEENMKRNEYSNRILFIKGTRFASELTSERWFRSEAFLDYFTDVQIVECYPEE